MIYKIHLCHSWDTGTILITVHTPISYNKFVYRLSIIFLPQTSLVKGKIIRGFKRNQSSIFLHHHKCCAVRQVCGVHFFQPTLSSANFFPANSIFRQPLLCTFYEIIQHVHSSSPRNSLSIYSFLFSQCVTNPLFRFKASQSLWLDFSSLQFSVIILNSVLIFVLLSLSFSDGFHWVLVRIFPGGTLVFLCSALSLSEWLALVWWR